MRRSTIAIPGSRSGPAIFVRCLSTRPLSTASCRCWCFTSCRGRRDGRRAELRRVARPGATVAAAVWDARGGFVANRIFLDRGGDDRRRRRSTASAKLHAADDASRRIGSAAWQAGGFVDRSRRPCFRIRMEFKSFEDYWTPYLSPDGPRRHMSPRSTRRSGIVFRTSFVPRISTESRTVPAPTQQSHGRSPAWRPVEQRRKSKEKRREHRIPSHLVHHRCVARHRRSLHARDRPRARAARERGRGLRLHARHRAAYGGGDRRPRRAPAYQRTGVPDLQIYRRRLSALHGVGCVARARRAQRGQDRRAALEPAHHHHGDPDQHPQSEAVDLLPRLPAAIRQRRRSRSRCRAC